MRSFRTQAPLFLVMVDVDHFKGFNDTYGHVAGDDCLARVAGALSSAARRHADKVACIGGEELRFSFQRQTPKGQGTCLSGFLRR